MNDALAELLTDHKGQLAEMASGRWMCSCGWRSVQPTSCYVPDHGHKAWVQHVSAVAE